MSYKEEEEERQKRRDKKEAENKKVVKSWIKILVMVVVMAIVLFGAFYTVPAEHRGVVLTFGKPALHPAGEGFHFKIPFAQTVKKIEVRTQKIETVGDSSSKDLQDVQTTVALNYHVIHEETNDLYKNIGLAYRERVVNPAIQESIKAVTARFTAEELITRRPEVRDGISTTLGERLNQYHLVVDSLNIVNFQFSPEFDAAIEAKVTAEQKKLQAENDLQRIIVEKQQKITQAQAEAESIRIQSEALKANEDILELRAIEKWDGVLPKVTGGATPFIDVTSFTEDD